MTTDCRTLAIAIAVLVSAPAAAQTQNPAGERAADKSQRTERTDQIKRAKERCRLNRGVDCDTPEGLEEWRLRERRREEAARDGSRHLLPGQRRPAPSRP